MTEEQVQKGYVWMNKVNKNIFNTTYEEIAAYFGTEGQFEKEEYIGYEWIEYVAQLDDNRALSVGLRDMDCVPGTMTDIILTNMKFQ